MTAAWLLPDDHICLTGRDLCTTARTVDTLQHPALTGHIIYSSKAYVARHSGPGGLWTPRLPGYKSCRGHVHKAFGQRDIPLARQPEREINWRHIDRTANCHIYICFKIIMLFLVINDYYCWLFDFLLLPTNLPILTPDPDSDNLFSSTEQLVGPYSANPGDGDAGCGLGKIPLDQQQFVRLSDQQQPRSISLKPLNPFLPAIPWCSLSTPWSHLPFTKMAQCSVQLPQPDCQFTAFVIKHDGNHCFVFFLSKRRPTEMYL